MQFFDWIKDTPHFSDEQLEELLSTEDNTVIEMLRKRAVSTVFKIYKNSIYVRGLIEFSNYCKQGCYYCGINRMNQDIKRFRLTYEQILSTAVHGYELGFRTLVLQGGEDPHFTDEFIIKIIQGLKENCPDAAITLSIGIRSFEAYQSFKDAGANRFLLRHESADDECFDKLHPNNQSFETRKAALFQLKELGYQTGTGFMVGAPGSSISTHIKDIKLIRELKPEMIGIGPFIPHHSTVFKDHPTGSIEMTLRLLAILRIENPCALIPSTTALNTACKDGRIQGMLHGANVLMPNLSPPHARESYNLYDNKVSSGLESDAHLRELGNYLNEYGYRLDFTRGDYRGSSATCI